MCQIQSSRPFKDPSFLFLNSLLGMGGGTLQFFLLCLGVFTLTFPRTLTVIDWEAGGTSLHLGRSYLVQVIFLQLTHNIAGV